MKRTNTSTSKLARRSRSDEVHEDRCHRGRQCCACDVSQFGSDGAQPYQRREHQHGAAHLRASENSGAAADSEPERDGVTLRPHEFGPRCKRYAEIDGAREADPQPARIPKRGMHARIVAALACIFAVASAPLGGAVAAWAPPRDDLAPLVPRTDDTDLAAAIAAVNERGTWYDDREMPPAFEDHESNMRGVHGAFDDSFWVRFTANADYPWRSPAGVESSDNAARFFGFALPRDAAGRLKPVAVRRTDRYRWTFPPGTVFVEVGLVVDGASRWPFQAATRTRTASGWDSRLFRPYRTPRELATALRAIGGEAATLAEGIERERLHEVVELADTSHPLRPAIALRGPLDALPDLPRDAMPRLMAAPFRRVGAEPWARGGGAESYAPMHTGKGVAIVPRRFTGGLIAATAESCTRCHRDAGAEVGTFDAFGFRNVVGGRHWYGTVRGDDGILSWHPFAPDAVSAGPGASRVRLRGEWVTAGVVSEGR